MPVIFVSLNEEIVRHAKDYGYEAHRIPLYNYTAVRQRKTYYVVPIHSLGCMPRYLDDTIHDIEVGLPTRVDTRIQEVGIENQLSRKYLPIGSSTIFSYKTDFPYSRWSRCKRPFDGMYRVVATPTMLLPQDISKTQNIYYAIVSTLYNVVCNQSQSLDDVDIVITTMGCTYGKMSPEQVVRQIHQAVLDFRDYTPTYTDKHTVIHEPNLLEQPRLYQNTEWFDLSVMEYA